MRVPSDLTENDLLNVKIQDNGEGLVDIRKACSNIFIHPKLEENGSKPLVRKTIASMINKANSYLPHHIALIVRDAYRSVSVQEKVYKQFFERFKKQNPGWSDKRIINETGKFVADPQSPIPPGHTTGGAVDVSLAYKKNGKRLPMKSSKISYREQTKLHHPKLAKNILKNRRLLYTAMTKAGFSNYTNEWWHYSFGDVFDAARTRKKKSIYGGI